MAQVIPESWIPQRRADGQQIDVRMAEAAPDRLVVINADYGYGTIGDRFVLEVPESGRLTLVV